MRILVTGDRGYVGCVMVQTLCDAGHEVVGLDAGWFEGCDFGVVETSYESRRGDVRDVAVADLDGFDAVVHLAAVSNDPLGYLNPHATYDVNTRGTFAVARAAKEAGVTRFLFASSCSLYGAAGDAPVNESSEFNPLTPYGKSKVLAEQGLHELADESFSPTYMRNATAYGSSPRLRADIVVNNLVGSAVTRGTVRLESDGLAWRPLVHVQDICGAVLAALEANRSVVHDQAFNIGREEDVLRIRDVAVRVSEATGVPVTFADGAGSDTRDYRVSFDKAVATLPAFKPRWTLAAGVEQLLDDMTRLRVTGDQLSRTFVRLHRIAELLDRGELDASLNRV